MTILGDPFHKKNLIMFSHHFTRRRKERDRSSAFGDPPNLVQLSVSSLDDFLCEFDCR